MRHAAPGAATMESLPAWLGHDLLAGALPWAQAAPATLGAFLERYTLRDASWLGLYTEPERQATLLLRWQEHSLLAVRFDALERCEVKLRDAGIASAVSGPTNRAADAWRTHLVDRRGGEATLIHSPGVRLLRLSPHRELLPILVPAETL